MTRDQIEQAIVGLEERDFRGFARRINEIDPVLGRTVELHADAAGQGGSPNLDDWIEGTERDAKALAQAGITTRAAAEVYWYVHYTEMDPSEDEAEEMFCAVYGRNPDDLDRESGVFSLVCAGVAQGSRPLSYLADRPAFVIS